MMPFVTTRGLALRCAALALLVALGALPASAQEPVGRAAVVEGPVFETPPAGSRGDLTVGESILLDHLIESERSAFARLTLGAEGVIRIPEETEIRIERHRVDAATGETESALSLLLGKVELALSSLFRGEVTVETPSATLGVKGTVVRVLVDPAGRTLVSVLEGVVEVTSRATGATVTLEAGEYTTVEPGEDPALPAPFDPSAGTLSGDAGGPDFVVPGEDVFTETPLLDGRQLDLPREPPNQGLSQEQPPPGP